MEIATAIVNATLLDLVSTHQGAHWTEGGARNKRWVHARKAATGCGEVRIDLNVNANPGIRRSLRPVIGCRQE